MIDQTNRFSVDPQDLTPTILCYPFPEVREKLKGLQLPQEFLMQTVTPDEARDMLLVGGFPDLTLPADTRGQVDFDRVHESVVARITERIEPQLTGLFDFAHRYPVPGSSLSIRTLMTEWFRTGVMTELAFVDGDYDGYKWNADLLEMPVQVAPTLEAAGEPKKGRVWFVSNPSATDGNWVYDEAWKEFVEDGHDIVYDAAYVGLTATDLPVDVSAPNIKAVLTSPSKVFGVFKQRLTGVTYTREPLNPLLDSLLWFKDVPAMMATLALHESFGTHELPNRYADQQLQICLAIGELVGKNVYPSDTLLMAHTDEALSEEYGHFALTSGDYRFRLSTLFERLELYNRRAAEL